MVSRRSLRRSGGVSLVELLVAMAIGLVLTLAIATVMTSSEGGKRSATSVNDANQTAAYVTYALDRVLRSAGSGYAQRWAEVFGCRINSSLNGAQVLPRNTPYPEPFDAMPLTDLRLAPVLVTKGAGANGSDAITVMASTAAFGESAPRPLPGSITANDLRLRNTWGMNADDLILMAQGDLGGCLLEQVAPGFAGSAVQLLPFAGPYYTAVGADVSPTSFGNSAAGVEPYAILLGNSTTNTPQFQMFGVAANNTLVSYELLRTGVEGDTPVAVAEGIVQMRVLYGVDNVFPRNGTVDAWVDPGVAPYDRATLMDGSAASRQLLRNIVALRLALIVRTSEVERGVVAPPQLTMFAGFGALAQDRVLTADERRLRHRVVEVTIPLRNVLLAPI
jgi:type IV pilus assembly protein PilW